MTKGSLQQGQKVALTTFQWQNLMTGRSQIPKPLAAATKDDTVGPSVFGSLCHDFPSVLLPPTAPQTSLNHDINPQQISTLLRLPGLC